MQSSLNVQVLIDQLDTKIFFLNVTQLLGIDRKNWKKCDL